MDRSKSVVIFVVVSAVVGLDSYRCRYFLYLFRVGGGERVF